MKAFAKRLGSRRLGSRKDRSASSGEAVDPAYVGIEPPPPGTLEKENAELRRRLGEAEAHTAAARAQVESIPDVRWFETVLSAKGRYTRAYFDWVPDESSPSGGWLYILNDWMVNDKGKVPPHCFNRFSITTGGGSETWNIRVYGDQTVWVRKNGVVVQNRTSSSKEIADGAVGFGMSPNAKFNHTIFELRFPASEGIYSTRLGDPVRYVSSLTAGTTCIMADEPNVFTYRSMQSGQQMAQGGRQMWSQGGSQGGWQQVGGQQGSQQQTSQSGMSAQSSQSSQSSAQQRTGQSGMSGMSMSSQQVGGQQQVGSTQHSSQGTPVESSQNT